MQQESLYSIILFPYGDWKVGYAMVIVLISYLLLVLVLVYHSRFLFPFHTDLWGFPDPL
jgi:hypothetical protein